ncbi:hypothetical protein [Burkholderia sp. Ac-20365]|uniref:hypothetical protein n=1 Tax=Burkholderia sp. Ac-20365 TaxID=2703897 RepID=UPI00197C54E8|nr:hypothetical protein [Burkholderia sp. Ac-20365]MBN3761131.1 hypothetical protein [Burkholderia sp. Ac-20365]
MNTLPAASLIPAEEPERKATPHTAVLDPERRKDTGLKSGLIAGKDALHMAYYPGIIFHGHSALASLRLGDEVVFYEVAVHGKIYRALARPVPGQNPRTDSRDLKYELVRTWAEGMRQDGWFLAPPPAIPNTPRALVREIQEVTGLPMEVVVDDAYSILNYRRHHGAHYPDTMTPSGYRFREAFLMSIEPDGSLKSLYETPTGVNPEKWTNFLRVLDRKESDALRQYAVSGSAITEFGEAGAVAMREAVRLRDGDLRASPPASYTPFMERFPLADHQKLERNVGGQRR